MDAAQSDLIALLDEMFTGPAWHGPALRGGLRGVTPLVAARRPAPGRHNIAELVVHCAYWKCIVRGRITGEKHGAFPLGGSNFFARDRVTARLWKDDLALLTDQHQQLVQAVGDLDPSTMSDRLLPSRWTRNQTIRGAATHDAYHAGQIQLIKRLVSRRTK